MDNRNSRSPWQDPKYRVLMVAATAMDNRNFGSCPPTSSDPAAKPPANAPNR
jgi:hypothetical protein